MRLVDVDPWTGVEQWVGYDEATDSLTIRRVQDVEPILDRNKALANDGAHWRNNAGLDDVGVDMRLVATIPVIVQEKWRREHGVDINNKGHWPGVVRLLNDPDWRWLKASDVQI